MDAPARTILVVDDDPDLCDGLKTLLLARFPGARVLTAFSAEDAMGILRAQPVDAVLSDHQMGAMDGATFLAQARHAMPSAIRVLMTGLPDVTIAARAVNQGHIHAFFPKPIDSRELIAKLGELLDEQAAVAAQLRAFARSLSLAAAAKPASTGAQRDPPRAQNPLRILVVDDVPEIGAFFAALARHLPTDKVTLRAVSDAREALRVLGAEAIDVVISDWRMPHASGIELLTYARSKRPRARRILITGYGEILEDPARLAAASIDAYLHKPIRAQDALILLHAALSDDPRAMEPYRIQARAVDASRHVPEAAPT